MKTKRVIKIVLVLLLFFIVGCLMWIVGMNHKMVKELNTDIDRENILQYVTFDEEISEWQKKQIKNMLERVDRQSLNYVVNSGGKIVVIYNEDVDIREYLDQHYGFNLMETTFDQLQGVTVPYRDIFGNLDKADIVIACGNIAIGELIHEFGHVYDMTHGDISDTPEFQEIYDNRDNINSTVLEQVKTYIDYYSSTPKEYFAELYKQYLRGKFEIAGYSEEKQYLIEYFDSLSIQR